MLKRNNPNLAVAQFWHIPWPNRETFRAFPWKDELLDGMLGNDLLGFHLQYHCANFLETIERTIEARVDTEHGYVSKSGHVTAVRAFPISIDFEEHVRMAASPQVSSATSYWWQELGEHPRFLALVSTGSITPKEFPTGFKRLTGCSRSIPSTLAGSCSFKWECPAGLPLRTTTSSIRL